MWGRDLSWDFEPTRRRLEGALQEGTLRGLVANDDLGACAYATYAIDEDHGIVGSFFAGERSRALGLEGLLVQQVLDELLARKLRVIDCQTLFSSDRGLTEPFAARGFESAARIYMALDRSAWLATRPAAAADIRTKPTHRLDIQSVARLVHEAHLDTGSVDASSSFDTLGSCEGILRQIILDEVCGPFDSLGSRRVEVNGQVLAVSLLTWPLRGVAHISEVATTPQHRRQGLARHCLTQSLVSAFEGARARSVTLSVTASNQAALALYESMGFVPSLRYQSHVFRFRQPGR